jgi:hypothetical protein
MSAHDELSLDRETVDAQREIGAGRGPERWLECGHARRTNRTDTALCGRCGRQQRVLDAAGMRAEAAKQERAVRFAEDMAAAARVAARLWKERAQLAEGDERS